MQVALVQMCSAATPAANVPVIERSVAEAAAAGAQYVQLPEMCVAFVADRAALAKVAEPMARNAVLARLAALAARYRVWLHLGSMAIALDDDVFVNRSFLFGPTGMMVATYDKIHLFDADLNDAEPYRESETYRGGDRAVLAGPPEFRLGLSICYDLRFAGLYRALAEAGAKAFAVPSAFTVGTGEAHWDVLLRARAIETGSFVLAAAQGGKHQNGRTTYGHSMIVGPWGDIIAAAADDQPQLVLADIDLNQVFEVRQQLPVLDSGRPFSIEKR